MKDQQKVNNSTVHISIINVGYMTVINHSNKTQYNELNGTFVLYRNSMTILQLSILLFCEMNMQNSSFFKLFFSRTYRES